MMFPISVILLSAITQCYVNMISVEFYHGLYHKLGPLQNNNFSGNKLELLC